MRALLPAVLLTACGGDPINRPEVKEDPSFPILEVEVDSMTDRLLSDDVFTYAIAAFHDAGVNLRLHRDQEDIAPIEFDGSNEQRHQILAENRDDPNRVHVLIALRRTDLPGRGGEAIRAETPEESGVIIYYDELEELHPSCGGESGYSISRGEARAGTLVHELGHSLQLGHDTETGGWINFYNVMSVPDTCEAAQRRFHGNGNDDPSLGAVEAKQAARFSQAAIDMFDFSNIMSIHTGELIGNEM